MSANLADLLRQAATRAGSRVALVESGSGRSVTWGELDESVDRLASGLEATGAVAGNRLALMTGNRIEFVVAYLAALRARLVAVPLDPRAATGELLHVVTDAGVRFVVADGAAVDTARAVAAGLADLPVPPEVRSRVVTPRLVVVDGPAADGESAYGDLLAAQPAPSATSSDAAPPATALETPAILDPETLAVLLYTSGAGADPEAVRRGPRGAMLTHRALLANIDQVGRLEPPLLGSDDVVYGALPLFHVYGLNAVLGQVLARHASLVLVDDFDADRALEEIGRHRVTVVPVVPAVLARWRRVDRLAQRLDGVRMLLSGSAPLPPELVTELRDGCGLTVHQGYGLTEAGPVVTSTLGCPPEALRKDASVGRPLPGVAVRVVDDEGCPVPGDDCGELLVAGDNLFSGYWPEGADGPRDGWLATGDLGYVDDDGDVFLVDRLQERIVVEGFTVYPSEVEDVIGSVEGVEEAAVVGEAGADGEAVVAYVRVAADGPRTGTDVVTDVRATCERRLARFKRPSRVEVVEALPRTPGGRLARTRLRTARRRGERGLLE